MENLINQIPVRIFAVIALYQMQPSESIAFRTLQAAINSFPNGQAEVKILLYDNTPGGQAMGVLPTGVYYKADVTNGGLAKAYNYALEIACGEGCDWLLTLDQDTKLPLDFLSKLCEAAAFVAPMSTVAAIVPCVVGDGKPISPGILLKHWALTKRFSNGFVGISIDELTVAINSGAAIRVEALKVVGGYDPRYCLDFSDIAMYARIHLNNLRVFVAGNIVVEHELSVFDLKNRTTPARYDAIRRAEEAFYDEYLGKTEGMVLLLRLVYRLTCTLWRAGATLPYFKVGLRFLCRRLFWSREHRMENWEQTVRQ